VDVSIMVEGQMGLNWPRWKNMVSAAERLGFAGLYRSDHFTNPSPPDPDSLELVVSLAYAASHTERIRLGQLVSPVSFRDPVMLARQCNSPQMRGKPVEEVLISLRSNGLVAGTPEEIPAQLEDLREAGVQELMLQWLDLDDLAGLEQLAEVAISG